MATSNPPAKTAQPPKKFPKTPPQMPGQIQTATGPPGQPPPAPTPKPGESSGPPLPPDISAERDPRLEGLADQFGQYAQDIRTGTGEIADLVGGRMRDAVAGVQQGAQQMAELRGIPYDAAQAAAEEGRAVQGALGDVRLQREALLGSALTGAVSAARAPADLALGEKGLGLSAYDSYQRAMSDYNAAQAASQATAYNQLLAVLEKQRTSPMYDPALAAQPNESVIKTYAPPAVGTTPNYYGPIPTGPGGSYANSGARKFSLAPGGGGGPRSFLGG